jgi:hypothetical protein
MNNRLVRTQNFTNPFLLSALDGFEPVKDLKENFSFSSAMIFSGSIKGRLDITNRLQS